MAKRNLVLVDAGLFCTGMHIKAKVYFRYKGNYVLLSRNIHFTDELLERLQRLAKETDGIYIDERSYDEIWNESLRRYTMDASVYTQMYQQVRQDYARVISRTANLLGGARKTGKVSLAASEDLTATIATEVRQQDQSILLRCINMIGAADDYLYTHCVNVASLNGMMGQWMNLPEDQIRQLIKIGLLHDLGKLKVPARILNKPGRLTEEEFCEVKKHPVFTCELLQQSGERDPDILQAVHQHHEKINGTGYPDGLRSEDICLMARITSVSDVYDAMVSKRCYKEASTPFEILTQFKENRFSDLDIHVVNTFLAHITYLFVGMHVKLSNGESGEIVFVPPNDVGNPVVKVGNHVLPTNDSCRCVSVESSPSQFPPM